MLDFLLLGIPQIFLLILKFEGLIAWSWPVVLIPLWIYIACVLIAIFSRGAWD